MIRRLFNLWASRRPYRTEWVEDLPEQPQKDALYIVGGRAHPFYAVIPCPREKCRQNIHLDVSPEAFPRWRIVEHPDGRISLHPSVRVTGLPCRCHYWLRRGRVTWCEAPPVFVPERNQHD